MFRGSWFVVVLASVLANGCFSPSPPNGALGCNPAGQACPDGYYCTQGACWRNGSAPIGSDGGLIGDGGLVGDGGMPPQADLAGSPIASACTSDAQCGSGHCTDGVCCNGSCDGQCEACDVGGFVGICTAVQGPPHGSRMACTHGDPTCGGTCDGTTRTACAYPPTSTVCGAACNSRCDGAGTCPAGSGSCPGGFACSASACGTTCSGNSDCQPNFTCSGTSCMRIAESDCLDGVDNNGDGLTDCADPTCTSVECVTAPTTGGEIGQLTSAACGGDYNTPETQHQGPTTTCTTDSCDCITDVTCSVTAGAMSSANSTCTSGTALPATQMTAHFDEKGATIPADEGVCTVLPSATYLSAESGTMGLAKPASCRGGGTGTPVVSWSTTTNFCAASRSSQTCASGQICVTKPATGGLCMRIPDESAGCPAGFSTGSSGVYFTSATGAACSACGCNVGSGSASCPESNIGMFSDAACKTPAGTTYNNKGTCTTTDGSIFIGHPSPTIASFGTLQSARTEFALVSSPGCTDTTTKAADAHGSAGSTICCQ
jgi:hypothetical protein